MRRFAPLVAGLALLAGFTATVSGGTTQAETRWVIADLGTLGQEYGWAVAINERGQVIGNSLPKRGVSRAFLWENGKMRDLGTLGGANSTAVAINERGQVVGWADTKANFRGGIPISHAFLWENGKMRDLGTLSGKASQAVAINERGQVVGWADTKVTFKGRRISHAFLWENGNMRDLGTSRHVGSAGVAINERDQIIVNTRPYDKQGNETGHAFLWENGKMRDLGTLGGRNSTAVAINERGQVVGWASSKSDYSNAFLAEHGKMRNLGKLGDEAVAINDQSQVIVNGSRTFLWQNGETRFIGGRGSDIELAGISEDGQVVGYDLSAETCDAPGMKGEQLPHAFIWANGRMTALPTLRARRVASAPGPPLFGAVSMYSGTGAMNDSGQIVGWSESGRRTAGSDYCYGQALHAVLWTLKP